MRVCHAFSSRLSASASVPLLLTAVLVIALAAPAARAGTVASPVSAASTATTGAPAVSARGTSPQRGINVTNVAVPGVSSANRATIADALDLRVGVPGMLIGHVRRPVMHAYAMVGVTWEHRTYATKQVVEVRTRTAGEWSAWTELETDRDGGPLTTTADSSFRDGTEPWWVGAATGVEVAVYGKGKAPQGLEVSTIDPGMTPYDLSALSTTATRSRNAPGTFPNIPQIITRAQWGADESLGDECWAPKFGKTFKAVIVHHTAGSNSYTRAESAALVRGIYAYHTESRGWCDIGYNFLIDRFGSIFEGRAGGIRRSVRGAHSGDYNVNTTGISLMGNFDLVYPTPALKAALVGLIAWRLGTAYHGAYGRTFLFDGRFSRISGHRDVMSTACPGLHVYEWLPRLRRLVSQRLGDYQSKIETAWRQEGGKSGDLGVVSVGEMGSPGGHHTTFQRGRIYLTTDGLFTFHSGPVLHRYVTAGETDGDLGYPRSDVWEVKRHPGQAAEFNEGRIYWSAGNGAWVLRRSKILKKYISLRGASGRLGFPLTGVVDLSNGARTNFVNGSITFNKTTGQTTARYR